MSWGPFEHLNIYLPYGLRQLGFKNTIGIRPLLSPKFFYHGWTVFFFPVKIKSARETAFWPFLPFFSRVEIRFHAWILRFFHGQKKKITDTF